MLAIIVFILRILLLAAAVSFIGWAMYTLWRDLQFQSQILTSKKIPYISIFGENDQPDARQIFTLPELRIGRDTSCDIHINDDTISTQHARVWYRNQHWWVEDLLSTNGTFLNEERVDSPTILITGDELRVGKHSFTVEIQPLG